MASTIPLQEALRRVLAVPCGRTATESVALDQALGRHLAAPLCVDAPWPSTDRSAMDGFAVRAGTEGLAAGARLTVVGESLAGHPFAGALPAGRAIRIMTGAVVPEGADAVVPVEHTSGFAGDAVELREPARSGQNVRPKGSEAAAGDPVVPAFRRIGAAEVGALAVLGHAVVEVQRRPRVAIVATGDEVVPVDAAPLPHQVRESNSWALAAQVRECGGEPLRLGVAPDEPEALRALLQQGLDQASVLVTIGGVSKGTHDLVHGALEQLGVVPEFHGIQLKPGKPTFFGARRSGGREVFAFGLPGNPASSFTVFDLLVRPLLLRLLGEQPREWADQARIEGAFRSNARLQAVPARLELRAGAAVAVLGGAQPSGNPFSVLDASAYALLPPGAAPGGDLLATIVGVGGARRS
ncbi:MAG: gephyrin-like molybdotransferase Glp [Planctomycetota bacterium]